MRRLSDLHVSSLVKRLDGFMCLNTYVHVYPPAQILHGGRHLQANGIEFQCNYQQANAQIHVYSDPSDTWGICGKKVGSNSI